MNQLENKDYIQTLISLKERILQAQYNSYSAVNSEMILAYLDIGKTISEKTATGWGTSVIKQLSIDLQAEFNGVKGFSERNLHRMKLVYEEMQANAISPQLVAKLHWGHTSLIRRACGIDNELKPFDKTVDGNFRNWIFKQNAGKHNRFSAEQMDWLRELKNQVVNSYHIEIEDLDYTPFDEKGGRGKMYQLFGNDMNDIINELNEVLAA